MPKYLEVTDNQWVLLDWEKQKEACCGCGLVHNVEYKVVRENGKKYLMAKFEVNKRATAAIRRCKK